MLHKALYSVCLMLLLVSFTTDGGWTVYRDEARHFKIEYPANWEQKEMFNAALFLSPKDATADLFQENLNVMVQDLSTSATPIDLEAYTKISKQQIAGTYGESAIEYIKDREFLGYVAKEMIYFMPMPTKGGGTIQLKLWQIWFIKDNKAYLITYTSEDKEFDNYFNTIKKAVDSFTLI